MIFLANFMIIKPLLSIVLGISITALFVLLVVVLPILIKEKFE